MVVGVIMLQLQHAICDAKFYYALDACGFEHSQASSEEGASKVYELLQGKAFRAVGWSTLFDCLSIYGEKLKQSLQTTGAMLPEFQEGDAKALVAYLNVLQKVGLFLACEQIFNGYCFRLHFVECITGSD